MKNILICLFPFVYFLSYLHSLGKAAIALGLPGDSGSPSFRRRRRTDKVPVKSSERCIINT